VKSGIGVKARRSSPDFAPLNPGYSPSLFDIAVCKPRALSRAARTIALARRSSS
jgi:hypothetical protein